MEKIKKFIDCYIPIEHCNLKCHYCYIPTLENFENRSREIPYSPDFIRKALSKNRWGGTCMINMCAGGETLLCSNITEIVKELLKEGHYIMIVTNGTITKKFEEFAKFPKELLTRLFFKFSFHYLELKRLNLMDIFFKNISLVRDAGASFTVEVTPNDEYIPYIRDIKEVCIKNVGAIPHVTVARIENGDIPIMTSLSKDEYIKIWSEFDSKLFDFKMSVWGEKRKEFCYAGAWGYVLNIENGDLKQCYRGRIIQNIYKNINSKIKEEPVGRYCPEPHCFNSHAFLAFGIIPEIRSVTFAEERNRDAVNGEWLNSDMKAFMSTKLYETNNELTENEKKKINRKNFVILRLKKIKSLLKNKK